MPLFSGKTSKLPEYILNEGGAKAYTPDALDAVAGKVWAQARANKSSSLIVYVHGRAAGLGWDREPNESFKKPPIIHELESIHNAAVLMIHWPHRALGTGFPRKAAEIAAPLLPAAIQALDAARPHDLPDVPLVVVTHSMGGIVLEKAVLQAGAAPFAKVKTIVTSASAAALSGSAMWLGKLPNGTVYVTRNDSDKPLKLISGAEPILGLGTAATLAKKGCAPNVFYLDVSPMKVNHRYFVVGDESSNGALALLRKHFYGPLYRGKALDPTNFEPSIEGQPIFRMRVNQ